MWLGQNGWDLVYLFSFLMVFSSHIFLRFFAFLSVEFLSFPLLICSWCTRKQIWKYSDRLWKYSDGHIFFEYKPINFFLDNLPFKSTEVQILNIIFGWELEYCFARRQTLLASELGSLIRISGARWWFYDRLQPPCFHWSLFLHSVLNRVAMPSPPQKCFKRFKPMRGL